MSHPHMERENKSHKKTSFPQIIAAVDPSGAPRKKGRAVVDPCAVIKQAYAAPSEAPHRSSPPPRRA